MGNRAQTAGILTTITGSIGILGSLAAFAFVPMMRSLMTDPKIQDPNLTAAEMQQLADFTTGFMVFWGIVGLFLSVFVIIAGVSATRRKAWGLGLAGSIVGVFTFFPTAIPAIIFMALAKPEFSAPVPAPQVPPPSPSTSTQLPPAPIEVISPASPPSEPTL